MPKFGVTVPHQLTKDEARSRIDRFIEMLGAQYAGKISDLQQSWEGDTLKFSARTFGIQLAGGIEVAEHELKLNGELPFAAMMFKGKIENDFKEQLQRIVSA